MRRAGRGLVRGHYIANPRLEIAVGLALFGAAALLLHDAYEKRAREQPVWLRPLSWW